MQLYKLDNVSKGKGSLPISQEVLDEAYQFAANRHQLFIAGNWCDASSEQLIDNYNPSNGERLGAIQDGQAADIDRAVQAAWTCFDDDWSHRDGNERVKVLKRAAELILQNKDRLAALETLDCGTPINLTVNIVIDGWATTLDYFSAWPARTKGATMRPQNLWLPEGGEGMLYTVKEPLGVVGLILPWNAPGTFFINKVAPALAAGCTVVVKPAEQSPLTALYLARLFKEAGLPDGALNVVTGYGHTAGVALAQHKGVKKISFTGSSAVGKSIARDGADSLKKLTLELGGKSAFVVMADADLDAAAARLAMVGFVQAGQFCMCPSRIFVDKSVLDTFVEKTTNAIEKIVVGSALETTTTMGPLITEAQRKRVSGFVDGAKRDGAEILVGGTQPDRGGYYFNPTLCFHSDTSIELAQEEVFGPVLLAVPFKGGDLDDIARMANDTRYGLCASVWTRDLGTGHRMVKRLKAGVVGVNSHSVLDLRLPFGGVKDSGLGKEFGEEGYESFLDSKTVSMFY